MSTTTFAPIEQALDDLRAGRMIILVDDEDRENEGDLVVAAEHVTPEIINFMLRHARGVLCLSMTAERCRQLHLPLQTPENTTRYGTAFTVTIDAHPRFGVTTGVSTHDRAATIRAATADRAEPGDLVRPGHINPLMAVDGGVLVRAGQTEGSVDLCRIAGLKPAAVIIEILNEDGTMARRPQLETLAREHGLRMYTVADLIEYRMKNERFVTRGQTVRMPTRFGEFTLVSFTTPVDREPHLALCCGGVGELGPDGEAIPHPDPVLVRVESECLTGHVFHSARCDCGDQLETAMQLIQREGKGALIYLRQEGRAIGLHNKLRAYTLQDQGLDTVEANEALGLPPDRRDYGVGAQICRDLGLRQLRILTNNPKKISRLEVYGLRIAEQLPIQVPANPHNAAYLKTKKDKLGHMLAL
ncbi:MAG: 3,4-dihydroxy-2-butanone-4-phosphate synthase [Phycisphaerae bacterium]|nr:MAG: 3,4-dihydroxy-2-butanone-4-phosphate synthase [Planctomycetota bacterium]KAB2949885.1 MAG: 3,4-dihydroxy-2-butanone-4-phosphate synthase [Phycisphaerae bacterium]MBE7457593.1 3,4-dihydroxy-2-butanone-4-phosphate synthase [Planctomycetia bacterium]MCK6464632.1 3,4-dihydroxy-2-butanone-4-phosphate synthase [Phycisphaerae bacterium]MCL4717395.1 3,4-dihydroxy-2-butanone-4-phosphate synthase [Phycisphaerae bacterium]